MHVPQDLMWREILKTFWISGWTKQGPVHLNFHAPVTKNGEFVANEPERNYFLYKIKLWVIKNSSNGDRMPRWVDLANLPLTGKDENIFLTKWYHTSNKN